MKYVLTALFNISLATAALSQQIPSDTTRAVCLCSCSRTEKPHFIIDDKGAMEEEFVNIKPNDIESIVIRKGFDALQEYGDKGKNGVVIIKTKRKPEENARPGLFTER